MDRLRNLQQCDLLNLISVGTEAKKKETQKTFPNFP